VQGGHDVHFLLRGDFEAVRQNGLSVRSCAGDLELSPNQLNVYRDPREMPPADWVIVTLKTTHNDQFDPLIRPLLHDDTAILTLQNGLGNEERLASLFGARRVLGGMAFTCINRTGAGRIEHTAHGYIRLGEFGGASGPGARASHIARIFNDCRVPCDVLEDLRYGRWEKLVWNVPFNGLSTVLDQTTDQLLSTEPGEALVRRIMEEVIASARACGVTLSEELTDVNVRRTREMGAYRTSMQVDRRLGRDLEVEAILGEPARAGAAAGAHNPTMQMLYALAYMVRGQISASSSADAPARLPPG
jgi:2-dehydropantoate 2-reductase